LASSFDQPGAAVRACCCLLQPARHLRGVHQEGKGAIKWTRLSCRTFAANAVHLQLHVLAYNLGNFMRTLALPKAAESWSLTSLREKLIKIGAKVVSHGRYVNFPAGRGRGVATDVRRYPVADRPAAGTTAPA
jgi:Transposase DDE domain group 1